MPPRSANLLGEPWPNGHDDLPDHYIQAQTSLVERSYRTLKHGDVFAVLDAYGDFGTLPDVPEGLFFRDTRYLSRFELRFEGIRPLLLCSMVQDDNAALTVDLTNPDIRVDDGDGIPRDIISINRTKFIWADACYERIGFRNYDGQQRSFRLDILFDCDFNDVFEVRGIQRPKKGSISWRVIDPQQVECSYRGLDQVLRQTRLVFQPEPQRLVAKRASYIVTLGPRERRSFFIRAEFRDAPRLTPPEFMLAYRNKRRAMRTLTADIATVQSPNQLFNDVMGRSTADLYMLVSHNDEGIYPYAGVPWYSTVFGRDGIIAAMLMLWVDPKVAAGVLQYLASTQATDFDPAADAQPGKILHERREGEMARTGEVPFARYYGTVDATALFVMLAGMYFERTGDRDLIARLWPHIVAAIEWGDRYGDCDQDGFVEYQRESERGLINQGWKDSHDSIFHADGTTAEGPIALCEVQGYVFRAKHYAARLARALGHSAMATELRASAERLRLRFESAFWCDDIGTYALALDGEKRPCRIRTTNAGHALFTGIAAPDRAARVAATLMKPESFSGWGLRTVASGQPCYNPVSYHNGSIWPHDNALIALGFNRYGFKKYATTIFEAMFDAAAYHEQRRLPELFCGYIRKRRHGPVAYPVACSPQAWAAAAPFAFIAACLGIDIRHDRNEILFSNPVLPQFADELVVKGLRLGQSCLDVRFARHGSDVSLNVLDRVGSVRVSVMK